MPTVTNILPSNAPLILENRQMDPNWYRYFTGQNRVANAAVAGEVATLPGSGLEGGGAVADGLTLSIAPNGVSNAMIRESAGTSVIGRYQNSTGDVADVRAVQNRVVLQRRGDQLSFFPDLDVPLVSTDALTINDTPAASAATVTHSIPIETDSGTMYILLSNVP